MGTINKNTRGDPLIYEQAWLKKNHIRWDFSEKDVHASASVQDRSVRQPYTLMHWIQLISMQGNITWQTST